MNPMAIGGGNTSLEVRVDGNVTGYERAMASATRATRSYEMALAKLNSDILATEKLINDETTRRLEAQHAAYTKVGRGMVLAGGGMLVGAGLAVKAAMDWQSAWTGVQKTVSGTPAQMAELETGLRGLSKILPASHDQIASVAEAAGQLGVQRSAIVGFTKVMLDMGASTNLTADEAATSMARFMNIMQTAPGRVSNLGATIAALGNEGASTESEIMDLGLRLAGAGHIAGMSEAQVLGIANALSSLGIRAEAGGSAISTMIVKWTQAVDQGGPKLQALADVAGMTSQKFAHLWTSDSAAAFQAIVDGLQKTKAAGGSVLDQLDQLGVTNIRTRDAMLRLAGSGDVLSKSLATGSQAWSANTALVAEAAKRYETTAAKLQIARNNIDDAAISVGQSLLPVLAAAANALANLATGFGELPGPIKSVVGPLAAVIGVVLLLGGVMMSAIPKIASFNAALEAGTLSAGLQRMGTAVAGLGSMLMGPVGIGLAVATTALTVFAIKQGAAAREVEALTATLDAQTGALTQNSVQWAVKKLQDAGAIDAAKTLGLSLGTVTDAALGQKAALDQLLPGLKQLQSQRVGPNAAAAQVLLDVLGSTNAVVDASKAKFRDQSDAVKGSTLAQKANAKAAQDGGAAMKNEADAATRLTKALHAVNDAILGSRAGARDYQQTLDDSRKTLMQGVRTLNISTKAGRDNQAAFDDIANSTLRWADALSKTDKTGRSSFKVLQQGRSDLYQAARAFGLGADAAHALVNRILAIPKKWETKFSTPGSDTSQSEADKTKNHVQNVPKKWVTFFDAETGGARAGIQALVAFANGALSNIHDEQVNINVVRHGSTVVSSGGGHTVPGQAGGGPVIGPGTGTSDSVFRRLSNGEHVWTTREVQGAGGHGAVAQLRRQALTNEVASSGRVSGHGGSYGGGTVRIQGPFEIRGRLDPITGQLVGMMHAIAEQHIDDAASFDRAMDGRRS